MPCRSSSSVSQVLSTRGRWSSSPIIPVAVIGITLGILGIILGARLLKLPAENTSYYRVYAWLSIVAGVCFVTFFLSPLGGLIDAAANIVLAMLFLKPDAEDPQPEFV